MRNLYSYFIFILLFVGITNTNAQTQKSTKTFNPDISANFLGLFQRSTLLSNDRTVVPHNGLSLQEAELQFNSDVDPYFKSVILLSVAQESGNTDFGIDPEEVYLETINLPNITFRAGKMKLALGKHNQLHTHAFPFIDAPLMQTEIVGDEGLNEVAVSAALLIPFTPWYSELTMQYFNPSNELLYNSTKSGNSAGLIHFKNLWDLSDSSTIEIGASATKGRNQYDKMSQVYGGDITFKWRPTDGGKYHAFMWSTEYLNSKNKGKTDVTTLEETEKLGGLASWMQYQFAERWWAQIRFEYLGLPHSEAINLKSKQSALLGFFPSEFSGFRIQYDRQKSQGMTKIDHTGSLQYNISIGAHPAHAY